MFTSEPSLAQRIERMIDGVPIVDIYSRIDPQRPAAPDLATLMTEAPWLLNRLRGVGYRGDLTASKRPESERIAETLPYLRQVRNTAAGWGFYRILRDLYDFIDPELTTANLPSLLERISQAAADPAWPGFVLQQRAKLNLTVTDLIGSAVASPTSPLVDSGLIQFRLNLDPLDAGDADPETIRRSVFDQLDEQIEAPIRCTELINASDLTNPVCKAVLHWHHLHEVPLLLRATGSGGPSTANEAIRQYPGVRLCLLTSLYDPTDEVDVLVQQEPGQAVATCLTWELVPSRLEAQTLDRIERLAATKIMGFASGATSVEWTYAAYLMTRRATAAALSRAVVGGYFEEDEIPPLCRAIFHDSPRRWLRLGQ